MKWFHALPFQYLQLLERPDTVDQSRYQFQLIKNMPIINQSFIDNHSAAIASAAATIPPKVSHFINTLLSLITLPAINDDKQSAPSGNARSNPFLNLLFHISFQRFQKGKIICQTGLTSGYRQ